MVASTSALVDAMVAAWKAGRPEQIIELAARVGATSMESEQIQALLGVAQQATNRHAQAVVTFGRLSRMRPEVSAYWNNLGVACRQSGDLDASERALLKACSLAPEDAEVLYNLGLLYTQQRRWAPAREVLLGAAQLAPQFVEARLQAAHACHVCGDSNGEEAMLGGARDWPPQPAEQALVLAAMLSSQGRPDVALHVLVQAQLPTGPEADPLRLRIAAQRVALYERTNQLGDARRELQQLPLTALDALPPAAVEARVEGWCAHAAMAVREGHSVDAVALYERALGMAGDPETRASAAFGLAAARDRQGQHVGAWQALQVAHAAQLETVREVAPEFLTPDSRPLPMTGRSVDAAAHAAWKRLRAPDASRSPVFVVGFPRSGTTLLEQMLDAHPGFRSMDERGYIHELTERMEQVGQRYPADLANLGQSDADQLRAVYSGLVARVLPDLGHSRLVDKNPLNMFCLPMIQRLFPEARIIMCLRHPCDVLLSCCMQTFRSPTFMVLCSSLERLARGYVQAFDQWYRHVEVFAPRVLEWRYESVVGDFDGEVARLGSFLDIDDASPMSCFAEHARGKRFISTPSYAQVTESVHSRSVARWEGYRQYFEPVLPVLQPWIERFGYPV